MQEGFAPVTSALFISGLHWWTSDERLYQIASEVGQSDRVKSIIFNEYKVNGKSKGLVYIEFATPEAATAFKTHVEQMDSIDGRKPTVVFAYDSHIGTNPFSKGSPRDSVGNYLDSVKNERLPDRKGYRDYGTSGDYSSSSRYDKRQKSDYSDYDRRKRPQKHFHIISISQRFNKESPFPATIPQLWERLSQLFDLDALEKAMSVTDEKLKYEELKEQRDFALHPPNEYEKIMEEKGLHKKREKEKPSRINTARNDLEVPADDAVSRKRSRRLRESSVTSTPYSVSPAETEQPDSATTVGTIEADSRLMPPPASLRGTRSGRRSLASSREASPATSPRTKKPASTKEIPVKVDSVGDAKNSTLTPAPVEKKSRAKPKSTPKDSETPSRKTKRK